MYFIAYLHGTYSECHGWDAGISVSSIKPVSQKQAVSEAVAFGVFELPVLNGQFATLYFHSYGGSREKILLIKAESEQEAIAVASDHADKAYTIIEPTEADCWDGDASW